MVPRYEAVASHLRPFQVHSFVLDCLCTHLLPITNKILNVSSNCNRLPSSPNRESREY